MTLRKWVFECECGKHPQNNLEEVLESKANAEALRRAKRLDEQVSYWPADDPARIETVGVRRNTDDARRAQAVRTSKT